MFGRVPMRLVGQSSARAVKYKKTREKTPGFSYIQANSVLHRMTEISLQVADCEVAMAALPNKSKDIVVTSPPYNLGIKYRKYNDHQKHEIYMQWTGRWMGQVLRILSDNGSFFLNLGGCPTRPLLPHQIVLQAVHHGWVIQNTFHWVKSLSIDKEEGTTSLGHFKPLTSKRFVNDCHEFVFHLTKHGSVPIDRLALGVPYADKSNIKRWGHTAGRDKRCRGNVWFIPYKTIQSRARQRKHPATFPPGLAENCILIHGKPLSTVHVLDPFVGIGNSALAAQTLNVASFQGFDIDEEYIAQANEKVFGAVTANA